MTTTDRIARALEDIAREQDKARRKFNNYHSAHEGYAVILEEVEELWDEIKNNKETGARERQRAEAVQVASTALRFIVDVCDAE